MSAAATTAAGTALAAPAGDAPRAERWRRAARALRRPRAAAGLALLALVVVGAAGAGWLAPNDPVRANLRLRLAGPSAEYPLGTDWIGRCLLSRLLHGERLTLAIGLATVAWGVVVGTGLGLVAGFYGGLVETLVMRATDLLLAFPYFLLTVVLVAVLGPSLVNAMIAIAVWTVPHYVRLVRAVVLSVKGREFVEGARALGRREAGIMLRHVLPACVPVLIVQSSIFCAQNMLMAASLSFLGLGAQPPSPELGAMLGAGRAYLRAAPQVVAVPALGIFVAVLAFNFLGDALRDLLDPRTGAAA
jgi:peptide/nickel transport system permease protein